MNTRVPQTTDPALRQAIRKIESRLDAVELFTGSGEGATEIDLSGIWLAINSVIERLQTLTAVVNSFMENSPGEDGEIPVVMFPDYPSTSVGAGSMNSIVEWTNPTMLVPALATEDGEQLLTEDGDVFGAEIAEAGQRAGKVITGMADSGEFLETLYIVDDAASIILDELLDEDGEALVLETQEMVEIWDG